MLIAAGLLCVISFKGGGGTNWPKVSYREDAKLSHKYTCRTKKGTDIQEFCLRLMKSEVK